MIKLKIAITVLLLALFGVAPAQSQGDLSVKLETNPAAGQIGPDNTFVRTTLTVVDASGQAVSNAYLKLHLDSPPGNPIISTDFPIVEDTALMNYEGILPNGVLEFESIYPIRGQYSFEVEAGRDATALSFKDTLNLSINENSNEVMNGVIFIALLLVLGLVAGIIIGNARIRYPCSGMGCLGKGDWQLAFKMRVDSRDARFRVQFFSVSLILPPPYGERPLVRGEIDDARPTLAAFGERIRSSLTRQRSDSF